MKSKKNKKRAYSLQTYGSFVLQRALLFVKFFDGFVLFAQFVVQSFDVRISISSVLFRLKHQKHEFRV